MMSQFRRKEARIFVALGSQQTEPDALRERTEMVSSAAIAYLGLGLLGELKNGSRMRQKDQAAGLYLVCRRWQVRGNAARQYV